MTSFSLQSPRLFIRPLAKDDLAAFSQYRADPAVARYQSWQDYQLADAEELLADLQSRTFGTLGHWYQLAVLDLQGQLLGDLALHLVDNMEAEVGFTLDPSHQGQGYATEALGALLAYLFTERRLRRVLAVVDCRNQPSSRVLERCGFTKDACHKDAVFFKGQWCSEYHYSLTAGAWRQRQP
ncbi:GNAT family N-acetyltransferase [Gallaecimonas xiamenensis]|uniref:N-acetyltransferase GCN5 n=1 Tax=Gallaecimonas xiamenensis 3-C-1 TaxID=745411 RepID=K2J6B4_9GAMM|nr:GNAT family protein [Gallaecimonas xiamenensis]EKE70588.1 N-acetyltransferase GCN5 [Gallaecimonas xiamenensis 3-C-1]